MKLTEARFSDNARRIAKEFPSALSSKNWTEVLKLADSDFEAARALAQAGEKFPRVRARNVIARMLRLRRKNVFARMRMAEEEVKEIFIVLSANLGVMLEKKATGINKLPEINQRIRELMVDLRSDLKSVIYSLIKDSAKLSFGNAEDTFKTLFRQNSESFHGELEAMTADRLLFEAKLTLGLRKSLVGRGNPKASRSTAKWADIQDRTVRAVAKTNLAGQTFSERIVDLSVRLDGDLRRRVAQGIADGNSPYEIAKSIQKYVAPTKGGEEITGPGVYRNPFRNAMRIARTETNRAYGHATAAFADNKPWITGLQITISPAHDWDLGCACEDHNGDIVSPEEFKELVPFHPHCMCYGTYVIDEKFLDRMAA